jgi:hypothetical protein
MKITIIFMKSFNENSNYFYKKFLMKIQIIFMKRFNENSNYFYEKF